MQLTLAINQPLMPLEPYQLHTGGRQTEQACAAVYRADRSVHALVAEHAAEIDFKVAQLQLVMQLYLAAMPRSYAKEVGGQTRILVDHILVDQPEHGVSNSDVASFEFSSGSSVVSNSARKHLASLAERIRRSRDEEKFVLVGHADQTGSLLRNLLLSGARAQALRKTLLEQYGVSSDKIAVAAHGYSNPRRVRVGALDRRVEVLAQLKADQLVTQDKSVPQPTDVGSITGR